MTKCKRTALALLLSALVGGCGSWWPFGSSSSESKRVPAGASEFACAQGRTLYVRFDDDRKSVWVFLPEREILLERASADRYVRGATTLSLQDDAVSLEIEENRPYADCKRTSKATLAPALLPSVGIDLHILQHLSYSGAPNSWLVSNCVMHDALEQGEVSAPRVARYLQLDAFSLCRQPQLSV